MAMFLPADTSQPPRDVAPDNGTDFQLTQLYGLLSCTTIEVLPIGDNLIMVLDEEGKLMDKPRNERATRLAQFISPKQLVAKMLRMRESGVGVIWAGDPLTDLTTETDYIVGDVLVCRDDEVR